MTNKIDDGGAAFPMPATTLDTSQKGMSLRDHFAGLAMQGDIAGLSINLYQYEDDEMLTKAEAAYRMADAMLKVRERKP